MAHTRKKTNQDFYNQLLSTSEQSISALSVEQIYDDPSHNFKISGDKYRGGCPFHESKSGTSFNVSAFSKLFYCPACNFGGNPVAYIHSMTIGRWEHPKGKDFVDAVKELASLAGISFPDFKPTAEQIEQSIHWERRKSIIEHTNNHCQVVLFGSDGVEARQYLKQRGIAEAGIKELGLGFLSNYCNLQKDLQNRGFSHQEIKEVGLRSLQGYITFPWADTNNLPLTIYGRLPQKNPPKEKPKTIALPGRSTKRSPLYLDRALQNGHKDIILVEGVIDAAIAQLSGMTNVCAYVAASCSQEQIQTIERKKIEKVTLCGDPDKAGDNGTASNLRRMIAVGILVYVAPRLPNKLDPDEFILKYGLEAWNKNINSAEHGLRWQAKRLIQQYSIDRDSSDAELEQLLTAALDWISSISGELSQQKLDTFFWSEINLKTDIISSGLHYELIKQNKAYSDEENTEPTNAETEYLTQGIIKLIETGATDSQIEIAIPDLARQCDRSPHDVRRLFTVLEKELGREENRDLHHEEVNHLLQISQNDIKLQTYIPQELAIPLEQLAVYLGVNNASLLTTLLTISASLLPIQTNLLLIKPTNFRAYPILYSGICAESGSGKSPLIKVFINSLSQLQQEEDKRYQTELSIYEEEYRQWRKSKNTDIDPPVRPKSPREYIITDATSEAIASIQNNQPNNGFLGYFDELAALFGQQNAYRGGRGSDAEKILSGRDGTGFKINRAGGTRINCARSGYSILGGIQPDILKRLMGDLSDPSGLWARFIFVNLPIVRKPYPKDTARIKVDDILCSLYKKLGTITSSFELSFEAQEVFEQWHKESEDLKMAEPKQALRAVFAKSQRLAGELALLLHCVTNFLNQQEPPKEVQFKTMQSAVQLTEYYIKQVQFIHSDSSDSEENSSSLHFKIIELSQRRGWIKARDVQNSIRCFKKTSPNRIRIIFKELVANGHGITESSGNKLIYKFYKSVFSVDGR